jgi:NitT/TauT family transport system substrate-binding protein
MTTRFDPTRRRFVLRSAGTAAFALGGGALLSACGDGDDGGAAPASTTAGSSGTSSTTAAVEPVRETVEPASLVAMMPFAASLGYFLHMAARTRGHFEAEQLDVDIQFARSAGQAMQSVLAGQAHIGQFGVMNLVPAVTGEGAELTSVAMMVQGLLYRLISSPDAPITTVQDIAGSRIGLPSLGGNAEEVLRLLLAEADVDAGTVELVPAGFDAAGYGLIEQGQIDGLFTNMDIPTILRQQGAEFVEAEFGEPNPLLGHVLGVTDGYLEANRDVVVRYLRALDGARTELEDPTLLDEVIADLAADWDDVAALKDPAVARAIIGDYQALQYDGGGAFLRHDEQRWSDGLASFGRIGAVEPDLEPSAFYTNELLDEATAG